VTPRELPAWLPLLGVGCVTAGMAVAAVALWRTPDHWLREQYRRYVAHLDRQARSCFVPLGGRRVALWQLGLFVPCALGVLVLPWTHCGLLAVAVAALPTLHLGRKRRRHVARLETQIDALLTGLSNALKSIPSPAAALGSLSATLPVPMRWEIDKLLGELRVGSTLEQGLQGLSLRSRSMDLDSALSAVLIGLQVGGNLPAVLENTASTVREMHRLEGVVKTKTAESRAQLWVLAIFPLLVAWGFNAISPSYFDPLRATPLGSVISLVALFFWVSALFAAHRILKVDI
jgi:tight adherence protein B